MKIALAGNPNSGKTSMFNALTGKNERVGNWAGVTVEKKESFIKKSFYTLDEDIIAVDLPGTYSISPFTGEEKITGEYIKKENPDVIINIVDATNLSRSLFFTTELLELGIPVVIALNKGDINDKKETVIDTVLLSLLLNCPVISTVSVGGKTQGLEEVLACAVKRRGETQTPPFTPKHSLEAANRERFKFVNKTVRKTEKKKSTDKFSFQDKIDAVLTNRLIGIPIFAVVMFLIFGISQAWLGPIIADYLSLAIEYLQEIIAQAVENTAPVLQSLLVDGIIGGVGAVLGFLPLVMIMYFLIALLEDCGYMARVSVVLDPIFKKVGLSGKSVIPFVIGTGCAIPGIMACRTIRDERERRATAMLTPFMPCGAKLPVISLFVGVFFGDSAYIGTLMYFLGIAVILLGALLINKITGYKNKSFFIMELPEYKAPSIKRAFESMCSRGWSYIQKAGTVILVCNTAVGLMQSFDISLNPVTASNADESILALIATPFSVLLIPLGFGVWQMAAATISGFIAKENVVGTLAVCYGITNFIDTEELALIGDGTQVASIFALTKAAALACLIFNLFSPPCFAAIGAMNSEMKSGKWLAGGIALQLGVGFTLAFFTYQIGTFLIQNKLGDGFLGGFIAILLMAGVIGSLIIEKEKE